MQEVNRFNALYVKSYITNLLIKYSYLKTKMHVQIE